jgi:hypothetical protein
MVMHLSEKYPLVTVCQDGEEQERLQAWFKVEGWNEREMTAFKEFVISMGADPEFLDPKQLVCFPGAINPNTGKKQSLIYFDPLMGRNSPVECLEHCAEASIVDEKRPFARAAGPILRGKTPATAVTPS